MAKRTLSVFILICMLFISACSGQTQLLDFIGNDDGPVSLNGMTLYFKGDFGTEG